MHQSTLEECVVKVVKEHGEENCSQDNLCLERTKCITPRYLRVTRIPTFVSLPRETERILPDVELWPKSIRESQLAGREFIRTSSTFKELENPQAWCSAVTDASFHHWRGHQEDVQKCRFLIASKWFNNSHNTEDDTRIWWTRFLTKSPVCHCIQNRNWRWVILSVFPWRLGKTRDMLTCRRSQQRPDHCNVVNGIICMNWGSRSKSTNYMSRWSSRRSNGLHVSCAIGKSSYKGIIENQIAEAGLEIERKVHTIVEKEDKHFLYNARCTIWFDNNASEQK